MIWYVCEGDKKIYESSAGPVGSRGTAAPGSVAASKTVAKGPDASLAQGPNKKLLL